MGYRGEVEERARARELRAQGWTMPDIAAELGAKAPGSNVLQRRKQAETDRLLAEGAERIGHLSERDFLIAGVTLYAGEGDKTDGSVGLANTDPAFLAFFCAWLGRFFAVVESRLGVKLYLHEARRGGCRHTLGVGYRL